MNYISHFYFDRQEGNDYYNLGIILPDLVRTVSRDARMQVEKLDDNRLTPLQQELKKGCSRHYFSDKLFHNSAFFRQFTARLKDIFLEAGFDQNTHRLSVTAHIFLEMMLDRVIISHHRPVADEFYSSLDRIDPVEVKDWLALFGIDAEDKFAQFFDHFRQRRYIYHYLDNESMVFSLNRVLSRVNIAVFEPGSGIHACIDTAHNELSAHYHILRSEVTELGEK